MKINWAVRLKNPWFWIGIASVAIAATGIDPASIISWGILWDRVREVLSNPVQLVTTILAVLAVFVDPTTAGICDSKQALSYEKPKKEE